MPIPPPLLLERLIGARINFTRFGTGRIALRYRARRRSSDTDVEESESDSESNSE